MIDLRRVWLLPRRGAIFLAGSTARRPARPGVTGEVQTAGVPMRFKTAMKVTSGVAGGSVLLALMVGLTGCDGDGAPDRQTLEEAVMAGYAERPRGCFDQVYLQWVNSFPIEQPSGMGSNEVAPVLEALLELGVLEARDNGEVQYHLTDTGEGYFRDGVGLCFVELNLVGLRDISSPFELQGRTVITVVAESRTELAGFADSVHFDTLLQASREHWARSVGSPRLDELVARHEQGELFTEEITLVREDDGWSVSER